VPGHIPEAAPFRFVLLDKGRVFLGGTTQLATAELPSADRKDLEKLITKVAKRTNSAERVRLGPGETQYRLYFGKRDVGVTAMGDPALAPKEHRELATLIQELLAFDHYSLRPYDAQKLLLQVRVGELAGGCRRWEFDIDLAAASRHPVEIPARIAGAWPTGAVAASVCHAGERYIVTMRPLVPGES
jgi:hypothetical protein